MSEVNKTQVGGDHYQTGDVQHWDLATQMGTEYLIGNITKYVSRWRKKNGADDVRKAAHYLLKLREVIVEGAPFPVWAPRAEDFVAWVIDAKLTKLEARLCAVLLYADEVDDLNQASKLMIQLMKEAQNAA